MQVRIQNIYRNFSFIRLNPANQVVANSIGQGDDVQVQWVDAQTGRAYLWVVAKGMFITINAANQVVGSTSAQVLQLDIQDNGSYVIRMVDNNMYRLILNDLAGPVTHAPTPLEGAADYNKQFWMLVTPS